MLEDSDANMHVAMQLCALKGNPIVCEILLKHGANADCTNSNNGATVLHHAAKTGNVALCETLIKVNYHTI